MRIALATDSTGSDTLAARHAAALAARAGMPLLTIHVEPGDDVADDLIERLRQARPTIVVLGTHARHGVDAVIHGSVAEAVARNLDVPTLIVPNHAHAFVAADGSLALRRIVIPTRNELDERRAKGAANVLLELLGLDVSIEVSAAPLRDLISSATTEGSLIVMATHGHDSVRDVVRGSNTEHVIRDAACPVLCVPA